MESSTPTAVSSGPTIPKSEASIIVTNWKHEQHTSLPVVLLRGQVTTKPGTNCRVVCPSFPVGVVHALHQFKILHPLRAGKNEIQIQVVAHDTKQIISQRTIIFHYSTPPVDIHAYTVRYLYVTASDQPQRAYDGHAWEMKRKNDDTARWKELSSARQDSELSPVQLALDKIGVAGTLLQCALHELMSRHQLEFLVPTNMIPSTLSFCSPLSSSFPARGGGTLLRERAIGTSWN